MLLILRLCIHPSLLFGALQTGQVDLSSLFAAAGE